MEVVPFVTDVLNPSTVSVLPVYLSGKPGLISVESKDSNNIKLWLLQTDKEPQLLYVLEGYHSPILLLEISNDFNWLCSISRDSVLLWQLEVCLQLHNNQTFKARPVRLPCCHDDITCVAFSYSYHFIAFGNLKDCLIIRNDETDVYLHSELKGHSADILYISFFPDDHTHLITASEDRTAKVWQITMEGGGVIIKDFGYISTSPFIGLSVASTEYCPLVALGTSDGTVRVYGVCVSSFKCPLVREIDCRNVMKTQDDDVEEEWNGPSLTLSFLNNSSMTPSSYHDDESSLCSRVSKDSIGLLILTSNGLLMFNTLNGQLITSHQLGGGVSDPVAMFTARGSICCSLIDNECLVSSFSPLSLHKVTFTDDPFTPPPLQLLSVLSSDPLVKNSPLKAELTPHRETAKSSTVKPYVASSRTKAPGVKDKPVTFRSTVKSSGYLQSPRMKMFQPVQQQSQSVARKPTLGKLHPLKKIKKEVYSPEGMSLISDISIKESIHKGTGSYLSCCGVSSSVYMLSYNHHHGLSTTPTLLQGHEGCVRGVSWSHTHSRLLSCSADRTVCVWAANEGKSLMKINYSLHNFKQKTEDNSLFTDDISHAQFYYIDKYILLTSANTLYMYKYFIDQTPPHDIKRYQSQSHYKQVISLIPDSSHSITALSAINDFHSYIVISAGSNRSINVIDMNTSQGVWSFDNAHSKQIHWITQNKGSRYSESSRESHDLFATSAINDGIKLWDLRMQKCVRWFTSFTKRSFPVKTSFSPCGQYISTGSEEGSVVVYDIRYILPIARQQCGSPVVMGVSYHPQISQLTCCSLDGHIYSFQN